MTRRTCRDRINTVELGLQLCESIPHLVLDDQGLRLWAVGDDAMLSLNIPNRGEPRVEAYWHEDGERIDYRSSFGALLYEAATASSATATVTFHAPEDPRVPER